MKLLQDENDDGTSVSLATAPLFTEPVRQSALRMENIRGWGSPGTPFSQYGLLAGDINADMQTTRDPRVFYGIAAPSSVFIC